MNDATHPAFRAFVDDLRALWSEELDEDDHWLRVKSRLGAFVDQGELRLASRGWPGGRGEELVLHHDPDHGFFVGGLVRPGPHEATPHDHAHTWTAYGVLDGTEITTLYRRTDGGEEPGRATIEVSGRYEAPAGHVDLVRPWQIHAESNNGERSVAITVRTEKPGGYGQNMFFPDGTTNMNHRGLKLIPFTVGA